MFPLASRKIRSFRETLHASALSGMKKRQAYLTEMQLYIAVKVQGAKLRVATGRVKSNGLTICHAVWNDPRS